jgi:hypothetical protein
MVDPIKKKERKKEKRIAKIIQQININKVILDVGLLFSGGPESV